MLAEFIIIFILLFIIFGLVYQFMFSIWVEVLIISLIFYISYIIIKILIHKHKKQIPKEEITFDKPILESKSEDPAMKTLKPFISKNTNEGFKPETIKAALLKQGWPEAKIDQAFKELKL